MSQRRISTCHPIWTWGGRLTALCGLLWLLSGCAGWVPPAYPVSLRPVDCPLRVPEELEEGVTIRCGMLQLPQDRAHPDGRMVDLPYAWVRAESAQPAAEPLVFIAGGPGGSALAEFDQLYAALRSVRRERDLIFYDQRGTFFADPVLECPSPVAPPSAAELAAAAAVAPAAYHPLDANDVAVAACAADLRAQGIDLAHYDTATHARDLLDLVAALGYSRYALLGLSYGSRIVLEALRLAPPGLVAVVLDSVDPPVVDSYTVQTGGAAWEVIAHTLAYCRADPACAAAYSGIYAGGAAQPAALIAALNAAPLSLPLEWQPTLRGDDLAALLLTRLEPALAPYLPRMLDELTRRDPTTLLALLQGEIPPPRLPRPPVQYADADEARVAAFVLELNTARLLDPGGLSATARREWLWLTARNPDRARLAAFIRAYLPVAVADPLLAQLDTLRDADLALVFAELTATPAYPLVLGANLAVECRDEVPFNDFATVMTAHRSLGIADGVVADRVAQLRHRWAQCALWPTGTAAPAAALPVFSALPALLLQGGQDTTTPPSWAATARATLSRSQLMEFPGLGHGVLTQAGCVGPLVRAFLAAPAAPLGLSCAASSAIPWSLPR